MNLAIKGHETRGAEVIEILKMLGGKNPRNNVGAYDNFCFYIDKDTTITYDWAHNYYNNEKWIVFTLEEFLEKFPYKVGDKVSSKYLKNYEVSKMEWESDNNKVIYKLQGMGWYSADELQPYKEETMEERKYADLRIDVDQDDKLATEATIDGGKITPPNNYLIGKITKVDNGMLVEFVEKQPQYPKTYKECCEVLGIPKNEHYIDIDAPLVPSDYNRLVSAFTKLLICRDAYWKIAGKQNGWGNPWEPDSKNKVYYIFYCVSNNTIKRSEGNLYSNVVLAFPTKKMRDAFFENFKELIENVKELL